MIIQVILIAIIGVIVARLVSQWRSHVLSAPQFGLWLAVWVAAIIVIALPEITSYAASRVGVTRGVDLVVYTSIILIFYILFKLLMRQERHEKNLTAIVRQLALDEALKNSDEKP